MIAAFPLKATGTDANVQVRGVSPKALEVRDNVKIVSGRMFQPGLNELVVGRYVAGTYAGLDLGSTVKFGGGTWTVVGVFDAGGSAFDSEVWCDAQCGEATCTSVRPATSSIGDRAPDLARRPSALQGRAHLRPAPHRAGGPRDRVLRQAIARAHALILVLGTMVGIVMGIGAVFGALNTMYSAVAERSREIATMRALGFGAGSVVSSFVFEALCIALVGGVLGCVAVLPLNGLTTGTMNWQTFSHLAFAFRVTPASAGRRRDVCAADGHRRRCAPGRPRRPRARRRCPAGTLKSWSVTNFRGWSERIRAGNNKCRRAGMIGL